MWLVGTGTVSCPVWVEGAIPCNPFRLAVSSPLCTDQCQVEQYWWVFRMLKADPSQISGFFFHAALSCLVLSPGHPGCCWSPWSLCCDSSPQRAGQAFPGLLLLCHWPGNSLKAISMVSSWVFLICCSSLKGCCPLKSDAQCLWKVLL